MNNIKNIFFIFLVAVIASGCATTRSFSSVDSLNQSYTKNISTIAVMPPDVTLSILTAGGALEPQAEWSIAALNNIDSSLVVIDNKRESDFVEYLRPDESDPIYKTIVEHEQLHRAVGQAILFNKLQYPLPTKKNIFDWTLGDGTKAIKDFTGADYALFIHVNDSYSSGGRVVLQLAAALLGVGVNGGQQAGFASLIDLSNGNVVWFNYLQRGVGDLRTETPALITVELLLDSLPD